MQARSLTQNNTRFRAPTIALWLALLSLGWSLQPAQAGHSRPNPVNEHHNSAELVDAAQQLEHDADRLQRRVQKESGHSALNQQAQALVEATARFSDDVHHGLRRRALHQRYRELADCLYDIQAQFQRRQYAFLSNKAERRLNQTLSSLHAVEQGIHQLDEQYSYGGRPGRPGSDWNRGGPDWDRDDDTAYNDADRLPGTAPRRRR